MRLVEGCNVCSGKYPVCTCKLVNHYRGLWHHISGGDYLYTCQGMHFGLCSDHLFKLAIGDLPFKASGGERY